MGTMPGLKALALAAALAVSCGGADGKKQLSGTIPAKWREAAKWNNQDEIAYAISMVEIEEENKRGGNRQAQSHTVEV